MVKIPALKIHPARLKTTILNPVKLVNTKPVIAPTHKKMINNKMVSLKKSVKKVE